METQLTTTPTKIVDRNTTVTFTFDRQRYTAYAGDTIASALYRAGIRTFSRSFKYHRPRGLLCISGDCPNCLMNVDGAPNVRSCMTQVEAGMTVKSQNAWPSLNHDVMSITDKFSALLPVGFYYKTMIWPRSLWPAYEKVLRNAAGLGDIDIDPEQFEEPYYNKQYRHADVAVVGGGPAGLSAALEAVNLGARVLLIDENPNLGGHLRYVPRTTHYVDVTKMIERVKAHTNIDILTSATAFGWYDENWIGVLQNNRLLKVRTKQLVVATGRIEQPLVFENNDLPGVMLGSGVQRLMYMYDITPARRALVVTTNDGGWEVARDLLRSGIDIAMIVDSRDSIPDIDATAAVRAAGVALLPRHSVQRAIGNGHVTGATVVQLNENNIPIAGSEIELQCDLISLSTGFVANNALLYQAGANIRHDPVTDDFVVEETPAAVRGAGHAVATQRLDAILLEGRTAGLAAAIDANLGGQEAKEQLQSWEQELTELKNQPPAQVRSLSSVPASAKKKFVCFCEDVTEKDLKDAISEGFDDIETLKRYSTISMGPCQGKMCSANSIRLCARETNRTVAETGRTTSRPPFRPVKLGTLAGRKLSPVRYTPIHNCHLAHGATMMNAGQWKRPEHYGNPDDEVRAVRTQVGIIDVSTLGKLDIRGPDSVEFLERIYTNNLADLNVGRIRYGVMCTEEGIIFDDGVVCRLADDHFYLTTTSSGATSVYEWLTWWQTTWNMHVHITSLTTTYAAVNAAGPHARDVIAKLTDLDLSNDAFRYMHWRDATVANVPARLLRIGFVGEMGYEIHYPAEYGEYLWNALMDAGAEYGMHPFGIEAQRILRLEKKHIIVGHDTDALSDPYGAGISWAVALDKQQFLGKPSLRRRKESGTIEQLVGFEMGDTRIVPHEGDQIVEDDEIVGRVTSARYSQTLGTSIGMGWVPASSAHEGATVQIRTDGQVATATVVSEPFYDPQGGRLRV